MASGSIERIVSSRTGKVTWRARFSFEDPRGRQHRSKTFKSKRDAQAWLTARQHEMRTGDYLDLIPATLEDIVKVWLERRRKSVRSSTWVMDQMAWKVWVKPQFGTRQVASIKPSEIQALYDRMSAVGRSRSTIMNVHTFLTQVFRMCVADGYLKVEPTRNRHLPGPTTSNAQFWTAEQTGVFLNSIADDDLESLWRLMISTGIRIGEVLVLTWDDFDADLRQLRINKTMRTDFDRSVTVASQAKTKSSNRTIILPASTVMALHRQRRRVEAAALAAGPNWVENNLIFPNLQTGVLYKTKRIRNHFRRLARAASVPAITLHQLRHTAATLMLASGVHAKVVQEQLGHANIAMTMDRYGHVTTGMRDAAAKAMDDVLGSLEGRKHIEKPGP
jgi:integrase